MIGCFFLNNLKYENTYENILADKSSLAGTDTFSITFITHAVGTLSRFCSLKVPASKNRVQQTFWFPMMPSCIAQSYNILA